MKVRSVTAEFAWTLFWTTLVGIFAIATFFGSLVSGVLIAFVAAIIMYFVVPAVVRWMAERSWFFAICPANKELAIEKFDTLHTLVFAPTVNRERDVNSFCGIGEEESEENKENKNENQRCISSWGLS